MIQDLINEDLINENEKEKNKSEFGELYYTIMEILFKNDPIGICFETNTDEYEHEVNEILPRLKDLHSAEELQDVMHQIFVNEFDYIITGKKEKYKDISNQIWDAYKKQRKG